MTHIMSNAIHLWATGVENQKNTCYVWRRKPEDANCQLLYEGPGPTEATKEIRREYNEIH